MRRSSKGAVFSLPNSQGALTLPPESRSFKEKRGREQGSLRNESSKCCTAGRVWRGDGATFPILVSCEIRAAATRPPTRRGESHRVCGYAIIRQFGSAAHPSWVGTLGAVDVRAVSGRRPVAPFRRENPGDATRWPD